MTVLDTATMCAVGPVVIREEGGPGAVVALEAPDERNRGAAEGVDVLVVVADREQRELLVAVFERTERDGDDQLVLLRTEGDVVAVLGDTTRPPCLTGLLPWSRVSRRSLKDDRSRR